MLNIEVKFVPGIEWEMQLAAMMLVIFFAVQDRFCKWSKIPAADQDV